LRSAIMSLIIVELFNNSSVYSGKKEEESHTKEYSCQIPL